MQDISLIGLATTFSASTNQSALTAVRSYDPIKADADIRELYPVNSAFKPTLSEGMTYHQDQLEWTWVQDFVVNYKALMQNRLNRVMQKLQLSLDETLRRSMTANVDDGSAPGVNTYSASQGFMGGWKNATATGAAMMQYEAIHTMAVMEKAVPVVRGNFLGIPLGPTIPAANYDPVNGGLSHRMRPKSLLDQLLTKPPSLSGTINTLADFLISGKCVKENGDQLTGNPFSSCDTYWDSGDPAGAPARHGVMKLMDYDVADSDVGDIVETKIGTGAFWSTTNYIKQFQKTMSGVIDTQSADATYSFMTRYTEESRNWYTGLLGTSFGAGGPSSFLRNRMFLALRVFLGSFTMDYSVIPETAPMIGGFAQYDSKGRYNGDGAGIPVSSIVATAPNWQTIPIAGAKVPNPSALFGFPLGGLPPFAGPIGAMINAFISGAFRTGVYFGSDFAVTERFKNDPANAAGIGGLDPYIGTPNSLGGWGANSHPMDHPPDTATINPNFTPNMHQSTGSIGIINDSGRSIYKNNLVVETSTNKARNWSPGQNQQSYDLWGTVDESKGLPIGTKLEFNNMTSNPIRLNPDMISNLQDSTSAGESFGSYAPRGTSLTVGSGNDAFTMQTYVPIYGSRIHQNDGNSDTAERFKNLVAQSYDLNYKVTDPTGLSKTIQVTPGSFYDGTSVNNIGRPTGGITAVGSTLDDDINKYLKFQDRQNARAAARLNPAFGNLPLGTFRGNEGSGSYRNPLLDTIAELISDPQNDGIFMLGMARDLYVAANVNNPLNDALSSAITLSFNPKAGGKPNNVGAADSAVNMLQGYIDPATGNYVNSWVANTNELSSQRGGNLHPTLGLDAIQERYVSFQSPRS